MLQQVIISVFVGLAAAWLFGLLFGGAGELKPAAVARATEPSLTGRLFFLIVAAITAMGAFSLLH